MEKMMGISKNGKYPNFPKNKYIRGISDIGTDFSTQ